MFSSLGFLVNYFILSKNAMFKQYTRMDLDISWEELLEEAAMQIDYDETSPVDSMDEESNDIEMAPSTEPRTSLSSIRADVYKQSTSDWNRLFNMPSNVNVAVGAVEHMESPPRVSNSEIAAMDINDDEFLSNDSDDSFIEYPESNSNEFSRMLFGRSSSDADQSDVDDVMLDVMCDTEQRKSVREILCKPKPAYTWNSTHELRRREHGLCGSGRCSLRNGFSHGFDSRFYSSRYVVERMKISHNLIEHTSSVNTLNFNRSGDLLCTGSDDSKIIVWDWAQNKIKFSYDSGHRINIFQTKFLEANNYHGFGIISSGRDNAIRHAIIPPSGGEVTTTCLYKHIAPVHRFDICPRSPREIISVGEDGYIKQYDFRKKNSKLLQIIRVDDRRLRLFGISHHPSKPEIVVCGCDRYVRVFDLRHMNIAVHEMCPKHLLDTSHLQVTSCIYNSTGSEVLASYSDDHIYLFNNTSYQWGGYLHQYRGHFNNKAIKAVNFFGPKCEYIISGSDCGHVFFWDKNTEAILNCMQGDTSGMVKKIIFYPLAFFTNSFFKANYMEAHPTLPILATSGLDSDAKIWAPISESYPPDLSHFSESITRNLSRTTAERGTAIQNTKFNYAVREMMSTSRELANRPQFEDVEYSPSSSSDDEDDFD